MANSIHYVLILTTPTDNLNSTCSPHPSHSTQYLTYPVVSMIVQKALTMMMIMMMFRLMDDDHDHLDSLNYFRISDVSYVFLSTLLDLNWLKIAKT